MPPLQQCSSKGKKGIKWGKNGKCYIGPSARSKALKQMKAIKSSQHRRNKMPKRKK